MTFVHNNEIFLIQPQGRLDQQGALKFKQQILEIAPEQHNLWIVDLAHVDFINSSGLLALVDTLQIANRIQCRLVLCNLLPNVKLIFEITQLDQVFEIFDSHAEIPEISIQRSQKVSSVNPGLAAA